MVTKRLGNYDKNIGFATGCLRSFGDDGAGIVSFVKQFNEQYHTNYSEPYLHGVLTLMVKEGIALRHSKNKHWFINEVKKSKKDFDAAVIHEPVPKQASDDEGDIDALALLIAKFLKKLVK